MNEILLAGIPTMSSREIAEITKKEHFHVMRDIRLMLCELGQNPEGYIQKWIHPQNGQEYDEFVLDEQLTLTLITGYSARLREAVIKRWKELEAMSVVPVLPNFSDPIAAARAWADAKESEQTAVKLAHSQALLLETQKPAVEFVERYTSAKHGRLNFRDAAKALNAKEPDFKQFLVEHGVIFLAGEKRRMEPYKTHIESGRVEVGVGVTNDERQYAFKSWQFTPKGFEWIAGKWMARELQRVEAFHG